MLARRLATFRRTVLQNPWMRHNPITPRRNQKQIDFLMAGDVPELLYGGAAGGGKSDALLMAALQYVEVPDYAAILFRRTYADLALPGALMDRAHGWFGGHVVDSRKAHWNGSEHVWTFPSGATLSFAYLDSENDRYRYQSSEFQYIGFDELTQFRERDYRFMFSRLRRTVDSQVPLRMRAGCNPGGAGHAWVKKRFDPEGRRPPVPDRRFIRAVLEDNPYVDLPTYERSLDQLDSRTRKQYRHGDWTDFGGSHYYPDLWPRYQDTGDAYRWREGDRFRHVRKADCCRLVALDWAMGKPKRGAGGVVLQGEDGAPIMGGDCTAFAIADMTDDDDGLLFMLGAVNERIPLASNAPRLAEVCRRWHPIVVAGDDDNLTETMLLECRRFADIPTIKTLGIRGRNKVTRSQATIVRAERGKILLPDDGTDTRRAMEWVETLSDQLASFTGADGEPDDLADAMAILGRLADEFRPGEAAQDENPWCESGGYYGIDGGW